MKNTTKYRLLTGLMLASMGILAQDQFTNNGNFNIHTGTTISFFGNLMNNSSFIDSGLVVTMAGTVAQQIGGSSVTTFKNLTLNNSAGSFFSSNENITNVLTITSGTFTTTGFNFTLLSNAKGTASIAAITGNFAGNITMQRYLGPDPTSWRFLAAPVVGGTIASWQDDFITSGFPGSDYPAFAFVSVDTYNETVPGPKINGYTAPTNASNPVTPGVGYWCYIGPVPITVDVTNPPAKFGQTFPLTYTPSAGAADDGWMMIGNPYPSAIDWNSPAWTKTHVNNAVYIWNAALQQYASWVGGIETNGGSNIIASSQAFWVQTNAASPALSCTENVKVLANPSFLRIASFNGMKLTITGGGYKDETLLQFTGGATNGFDAQLDARKLFSSNASAPGIATQDSTQTDMSINCMAPLLAPTNVPLKTISGSNGTFTIKLDSTSVLPAGYCVILEDLVTHIQTNLDSIPTYTFSMNDTTMAARFILHFVQCNLTAIPVALSPLKNPFIVFPNPANAIINVKMYTGQCESVQLQIMDAKGNIVVNDALNTDAGDNSFPVNIRNLAVGVYFIECTTHDKTYTTRFVKQ
jgi:hypothetical protein